MVYLHNEMLYGSKNERTIATSNNMSESRKYNFKKNKPHKIIYLLFHLYKVHKQAKLIFGVII